MCTYIRRITHLARMLSRVLQEIDVYPQVHSYCPHMFCFFLLRRVCIINTISGSTYLVPSAVAPTWYTPGQVGTYMVTFLTSCGRMGGRLFTWMDGGWRPTFFLTRSARSEGSTFSFCPSRSVPGDGRKQRETTDAFYGDNRGSTLSFELFF